MTTIQYREPDHPIEMPSWLPRRSWLGTADARSRRTAMTGAASSSGRPTTAWSCSRPLARVSNCSVPRWKIAVWRPRRSTGGSRRCAGSTGSLISTAGSDRTLPSTSAGRRFTPRTLAVWIAPSSACSSSLPSSTTASTPRSRCCSDSTDCESARRVPPTSKPRDRTRSPDAAHPWQGNKPTTIPLVPRTARTIDLAVGERHEGPILRRRDGQRLDRRTAHRWVRSIGRRAGLGHVHPHMLRAAFIMAALDAGVPLRDVQTAARHSDPRTTTIYDRRRQIFDRHAAYVVVAFVAGG